MKTMPVDFAVVGSSPLSRLLAGLLASLHGRRVVHVGESQSSYRLPRSIDLSVAPVTRPDTWAILTEGVAETQRLVGRLGGRGAWNHVDAIFLARTDEGGEALSHIRNTARGFRTAVEPVAASQLAPDRQGILLRDAIRLNRPVLEPALDDWLDKHNVDRLNTDHVSVGADGSSLIQSQGLAYEASQTVLADGEAIMAWLPLRQWPALFRRRPSATILTTPIKPLPAVAMIEIDTGTVLQQQIDGGVAAIGSGDLAGFAEHLQTLLANDRRVEQAGQTTFTALITADGAPAFGRAGGSGADVIAGTGSFGPFLAPALARWLVGEAPPHQANWFGARLVNRNAETAGVSDYAPLFRGQPL